MANFPQLSVYCATVLPADWALHTAVLPSHVVPSQHAGKMRYTELPADQASRCVLHVAWCITWQGLLTAQTQLERCLHLVSHKQYTPLLVVGHSGMLTVLDHRLAESACMQLRPPWASLYRLETKCTATLQEYRACSALTTVS